jgi:hypothetical protein
MSVNIELLMEIYRLLLTTVYTRMILSSTTLWNMIKRMLHIQLKVLQLVTVDVRASDRNENERSDFIIVAAVKKSFFVAERKRKLFQ